MELVGLLGRIVLGKPCESLHIHILLVLLWPYILDIVILTECGLFWEMSSNVFHPSNIHLVCL